MPYYRAVGEIPRKRHIQLRRPDGGLYAEELMGEEGFSSDSSLLYHVHPPTAIVKSEGVPDAAAAGPVTHNLPLVPRHFRTQDLPQGGDLVLGRQLLLGNDDVRIHYAAPDIPSELYRNSAGDEMVYLQSGHARFESVYGAIGTGPGTRSRTSRNHPPVDSLDRKDTGKGAGGRGKRAHRDTEALPAPPGSSWSTRRTASGTCAARTAHCSPRGRMCLCLSATGRA